jgi:hypothetical protein
MIRSEFTPTLSVYAAPVVRVEHGGMRSKWLLALRLHHQSSVEQSKARLWGRSALGSLRLVPPIRWSRADKCMALRNGSECTPTPSFHSGPFVKASSRVAKYDPVYQQFRI